MKKFLIIIISVVILIFAICFNSLSNNNNEYLRFHVRANSNSAFDQYVKAEVKDKIVALLDDNMNNFKNYDEAYNFLNSSTLVLQEYANVILKKLKCDYKALVKIDKEYFEEKQEVNFSMKAGYYQALVINLGEARGNNWWCLVYPSLSFVPINDCVDYTDIIYKSKIAEIYKNIRNCSNSF